MFGFRFFWDYLISSTQTHKNLTFFWVSKKLSEYIDRSGFSINYEEEEDYFEEEEDEDDEDVIDRRKKHLVDSDDSSDVISSDEKK